MKTIKEIAAAYNLTTADIEAAIAELNISVFLQKGKIVIDEQATEKLIAHLSAVESIPEESIELLEEVKPPSDTQILINLLSMQLQEKDKQIAELNSLLMAQIEMNRSQTQSIAQLTAPKEEKKSLLSRIFRL